MKGGPAKPPSPAAGSFGRTSGVRRDARGEAAVDLAHGDARFPGRRARRLRRNGPGLGGLRPGRALRDLGRVRGRGPSGAPEDLVSSHTPVDRDSIACRLGKLETLARLYLNVGTQQD